MDIYKQVRAIIDAHHLDAYSILRKENSIELASYIYDEAPVRNFASLIYSYNEDYLFRFYCLCLLMLFTKKCSECYRTACGYLLALSPNTLNNSWSNDSFSMYNYCSYTEPLNYSEIQSRARIWDTVNEKWLQEISNVEAALKDNKIEADDKRIEVKKLFERTIPFSQLLADVSAKGNALENLRRCAKGGCVQDLIFWDDFIQNFDRMLHIVTDITPWVHQA